MNVDLICIWISGIVLRGRGYYMLIQKNGFLRPLGNDSKSMSVIGFFYWFCL